MRIIRLDKAGNDFPRRTWLVVVGRDTVDVYPDGISPICTPTINPALVGRE